MEDHPILEPGHDIGGGTHVHQHGVRGEHSLDCRGVGGFDALGQLRVRPGHAVESFEHPGVRARRRRPGDIGD